VDLNFEHNLNLWGNLYYIEDVVLFEYYFQHHDWLVLAAILK